MKLGMRFSAAMFALGAALPAGLMVAPLTVQAATAAKPAPTGTLSGTVTGPGGPEAGVLTQFGRSSIGLQHPGE